MPADTIAQYYCERCERYLAEDAIVTIAAADGRVKIPGCPTCRGHVRREEQEVKRPLERVVLRDALAPIASAKGAPLLLSTTIAGFSLSRFVPLVGWPLALAILLAHAAESSRAAADPRHDGTLGGAADFATPWDLLAPVVRRGLVFAVALAPLLSVYALSNDPTARAVGTLLGVAAFVLYTPAGLVVATRAKSFLTVLSPIAPIRIAWRMGSDYLLAAALHLASTLAGGALVAGAFALAGILDRYVAIVPFFLAWAVLVGVTTAQARILGIFVRQHRHVLGLDG